MSPSLACRWRLPSSSSSSARNARATKKRSTSCFPFLKVALDNPDLRLFSIQGSVILNDEQKERQYIIFAMLISLFERAYLLLYEENMAPKQARRWNSWEDYMHEWCDRPDFHASLPKLLRGEDPSFIDYMNRIAAQTQTEVI